MAQDLESPQNEWPKITRRVEVLHCCPSIVKVNLLTVQAESQQTPGLAASEGPPAKKRKGPARKKKGPAKKIGPAKKKKGKSLPEPQTPPTADNEEEEEFDVERIVDKLREPGEDEPRYRVRWVGWPPGDDSWELESTLGKVRGLIEEFERANSA